MHVRHVQLEYGHYEEAAVLLIRASEDEMTIILILLLILQLSQQQTYVENPLHPPHGCENFGLCAKPKEVLLDYFFSDEYYYTCDSSDCVCNNGTSGTSCSQVEDLCATMDPCPKANSSRYTCTSGVGSYKCDCAAGYTGPQCDRAANSVCKTDTCLNGGTCSTTDNVVYNCACPTDYMGQRCQNKNPCLSKTCQNGGTCEPLFGGSDFVCNCDPYYQGEYCAVPKIVWTDPPELQGCFAKDPILDDSNYYKKLTVPTPMTVTNCRKNLEAQTPTYTMFSEQRFLVS
ncbi:hypothetical protein GCK32_000024 [Trichostrongylus colubriformis]|uniref:EGF-like domain-containing protein n=1 Tax=Trichostrongylus colubriformis TaxID=6319 RepID=A0AAN8IQU5_TRICO